MEDSKLFTIYNLIIWILSPLIIIYLLVRLTKGKEHKTRLKERFGIPTLSKAYHGKLVWIHVASVGEAISSFNLIQNLCEAKGNLHFLVTSGTIKSAEVIKKQFNNNSRIIHQFIPIDHQIPVRNFIKFWKPDLTLWFESELWPNLIRFASKNCPVLLLNARVSDKSFNKWQRFRFFIIKLFEKFQYIYPQSVTDFKKYQALGAINLKFIGNLKFANIVDNVTLESNALQAFQGRKVILAGSTHEGEEKGIIEIYNRLKRKFNDLTLILAPRHLSRIPNIVEILETFKNKYTFRTAKEYSIADVYIVDTMGELTKFYNIADIIFIGGSMIDHGGHNPLEASKLGKFVFVGPYTYNFTDIVEKLTQYQILKTIDTWEELYFQIQDRLESNAFALVNQNIADSLNREGQEIMESYISEISKYL